MKLNILYGALAIAASFSLNATASQTLRIATFNVSMDATNHTPKGEQVNPDALVNALKSNHQQIKNIAEIIQRVRPDIILLNEFDYVPKAQGIDYLNASF
jgi:predicted extracellular nuclease